MSIRFVKISSPDPVIEAVAGTLARHLKADESVLWLISGGSVINLAVAVAEKLAAEPLGNLTISLTDERPGPVGHPDSNWCGLEQAGFKLRGAKLVPVLTGQPSAADTAAFGYFLDKELAAAKFCLGFFGVGPDGHTAGLPAKNAAAHNEPAAYYEAGSFKRISMTPASIARLNEAIVYMSGASKHEQVDHLTKSLPYSEQSAQALKQAPAVTVFNDYKGDSQ